MWRNQKPHTLFIGLKTGVATLETSPTIPEMLNMELPCFLSTYRYMPFKRNETICTHESLYMNAHSSIILNIILIYKIILITKKEVT